MLKQAIATTGRQSTHKRTTKGVSAQRVDIQVSECTYDSNHDGVVRFLCTFS